MRLNVFSKMLYVTPRFPKKDNICLGKSENGRKYGTLDFVWNSSYSICNLILWTRIWNAVNDLTVVWDATARK